MFVLRVDDMAWIYTVRCAVTVILHIMTLVDVQNVIDSDESIHYTALLGSYKFYYRGSFEKYTFLVQIFLP